MCIYNQKEFVYFFYIKLFLPTYATYCKEGKYYSNISQYKIAFALSVQHALKLTQTHKIVMLVVLVVI